MAKKLNILKIVREDILRILSEKGEVSLNNLKNEIKVSYFYISKEVDWLKGKGLVYSRQGFLGLTEKGAKAAEDVFKKHLIIENYFRGTRNDKEAHNLADFLEHYVSEEVVKNLKLLSMLKGRGVPLAKFELFRKLLIADINIVDNKLFERMVSLGIFPGETIAVTNKIFNGVVIKIGNKKFALGEDIAKKIKAIKL